MNRAERRRLGKQSDPTYTLKNSDVEKIKQDAMKEAVDRAFLMMLGIPILACRDEFGFGKKRIQTLTKKILNIYDSYNNNLLSLSDIIEVLYDEVDFKLITKDNKDLNSIFVEIERRKL